jgi:hypothetical protein
MALTAAQICNIARNRAKATGYLTASGQYLNLALQEIALTGDYEAAKAPFNFNTSGALAPIGNLQAQLASGPFPLPLDYLRAKKGDIHLFWVQGFPVRLEPIDLEEFDGLVQQAGFQNIPVFWVTDMSVQREAVSTYGSTIAGNGLLSGLGNLNGISVGHAVYGDAIAVGSVTLVTGINVMGGSVTVSPASNVIATYASSAVSSLVFGVPPNVYVWAPAQGPYPVLARYYRKLPDIITPESSQQIPWFQYSDFLIDEVTGRLMLDTGDTRWRDLVSGYMPERLRKYLQMKDDTTNRAKRVTMDRRRFGSAYNSLPRSKVTGY